MTSYLIKGPVTIEGAYAFFNSPTGRYAVPTECVEALEPERMEKITSMHQYGLLLEGKDLEIKQLKLDLSAAQVGGQPASKVRDLVLTVLKDIYQQLVFTKTEGAKIDSQLQKLIQSLAGAIPGDVQAVDPKPHAGQMVTSHGGTLNHGPRDNDAAAPEYRR